MAKGAAHEAALAELHAVLAKVLTAQVGEQATEEQEDGSEVTLYIASPALLTVALKMLKDNDITCVAEEDSSVNNLAKQLEDRKKGHGKVLQLHPTPDQHAHG